MEEAEGEVLEEAEGRLWIRLRGGCGGGGGED